MLGQNLRIYHAADTKDPFDLVVVHRSQEKVTIQNYLILVLAG
jgi:hypothetical protein